MAPKIHARSSSEMCDKTVIKSLNESFANFENRVKNYNSGSSFDSSLPIRIIELFSRLFKIWSDVPELSNAIDDHLFLDVYWQLKEFFDEDSYTVYSDSSADYSDEDGGGTCLCENVSALQELMQSLCNNDERPSLNSSESTKKIKVHKVIRGDEWLSAKNSSVLCEVCNMKFGDTLSLVEHMTSFQHLKNYDIVKENEHYILLPDEKKDCYRCKICECEYSNLNSLVKHFFKPQHVQYAKTHQQEVKQKENDSTTKNRKNIINVDDGNAVATSQVIKATAGASCTKSQYNYKFIVSKGVDKFCQICEKDLLLANVSTHVKGVEHAKRISFFECNQEYAKLSKSGDKFHCLVCGVFFHNVKKLADHFTTDTHRTLLPSNVAASMSALPASSVSNSVSVISDSSKPKLDDQNLVNSIQLHDSNKQFIMVAEKNAVQCILCCVKLNTVSQVNAHINDKSHSANVREFSNYGEYFTLPLKKGDTFSCTKCSKKCQHFASILGHCQEVHVPIPTPIPIPPMGRVAENVSSTPSSLSALLLDERDEKFIKKIGKSNKCILCAKELPTQATLISHCGSVNHLKNANVLIKNEKHAKLPRNNCVTFECSLCKLNFEELTLLVKHFKDETHQKNVAFVQKIIPQKSNNVHIPSHSISKGEEISKFITSPSNKRGMNSSKVISAKKSRKLSESSGGEKNLTVVKKNENERDKLKSTSDVGIRDAKTHSFSIADDSYKPFPVKKPDNSFVVARKEAFYCRLCDVDVGAIEAAAHLNGATHRINVEVLESCRSYFNDAPSVNEPFVECVLCGIKFEQIHELVKHFKEKRHSKSSPSVARERDCKNDGYIFGASSPPFAHTTVQRNANVSRSQKRVKINKCDRKHIFRLNGAIRCNLCGIKLSDMDALEAHISNLNHKRNSSVYQENETFIKQLDSIGSSFECTLCAFCSPLDKVIKHCKKQRHLKAKNGDEKADSTDEEEAQHAYDNDNDNSNSNDVVLLDQFDHRCIVMINGIVRCNLCFSKLSRKCTLISHMNGPGHKYFRRLFKANQPFIEHFDELGFSYRCSLCDVIFTRLDTMMKHCSEQSHEVQLKSRQHCGVIESDTKAERDDVFFNITTCDFECTLCSITFCGFASLAKHCYSKQHKILKNAIQPVQKTLPYNVTITDYQYHCNACDTRLYNKAEMQTHQNTKTHARAEKHFKCETAQIHPSPVVIELVGYEYLCNFCFLPMYSEAELVVHEKSELHKLSRNFDDVWRLNEAYVRLNNSSDKVFCKLCDETFGIERLIQHCTSRDHRMKFIAEQIAEFTGDEYIIYKNATPYCNLCDCKLINDHNLVNHINSEGHKSKIIVNSNV